MNDLVSWKAERARLVRAAPLHVGRGSWVRETKERSKCRVVEHRKASTSIGDRVARIEASYYVRKQVEPADLLKAQFVRLADEWRKGIGGVSSATKIILHPAYQAIIGLGPEVVPLILRELASKPGHWGWALRALTNENPVPSGAAGNLRAISNAWLDWGRRKGIIA